MIRMTTMTVLAALLLPIGMMRAKASADDGATKDAAAENKNTEGNATHETQRNSKDAEESEPPDWSEPIEDLEFRLSVTRKEYQAWELPTFVIEVRNAGDDPVTAQTVKKVFKSGQRSDLRFSFRDPQGPQADRWTTPEIRLDMQKFVGLKPGKTMSATVTMAAYPLTAGQHAIGLGVLGNRGTPELKTNSVTLTVLPPGVQNRKELKRFLKPYSAGETPILAGFVPNKTTLVEGEPIFATFMVENPRDKLFAFAFGGDYRGADRHNRFKIDVIGPDGKPVEDPTKFPGDFGGMVYGRTARGHEATVEAVDLLKYRAIAGPGKFKVTCRFDLTASWNEPKEASFNVPVETTYELTILPRDPANVERVLNEYFGEANQTGGLALDKLIETISSFGQESAVAGLQSMGTERDVEHRVAAAKGLGKIAAASAMEALFRMNHDAVVEVRAAVIAALGAFTDGRAVETVVKSLADTDEPIRGAASAALGRMKTDAAIDALIERLPKSDPEDRAAILRGMGTSKSPRVFAIIVESLASQEVVIWKAALDAIVNYSPVEAAEALQPFAANSPNMDFREVVVRTIAETLRQPIEMDWLTPVIKSRKGSNGDVPRLMRLYGGERAVPALLSCLDFENPVVKSGYRNGYNSAIIDDQLACEGAMAIPWSADEAKLEENRLTLQRLKAWVEYWQAHPNKEGPLPANLKHAQEEKLWGQEVDDLSIHARVNRTVWPAGLPQVVSFDARGKGGQGSVMFASRPEVVEVEVNGEWYELPKEGNLSVCGSWTPHRGDAFRALQLDGRWRRKTDGQALELKPGDYTVRVAVSRTPAEKRTGVATSKPVTFEVIPTE
jgi:hypothetical protein